MQRKIIEFTLGAFSGVMLLMTFAYMSVEIHGFGPVTVEISQPPVQQIAGAAPTLMLNPPKPFDIEQSPILQLIMPQPAAAAELLPYGE